MYMCVCVSPLKINEEYIYIESCMYIHACVCGDIMMDASPDF